MGFHHHHLHHVLDFKPSHISDTLREVMLPGRTHEVIGSRFSENLTLPDIIVAASSDGDPKSLVQVEDDEEDDSCGRQMDETQEMDVEAKELDAFHGKRSKV